MTPKDHKPDDKITQLSIDVGVIKSQMTDLKAQNSRIENVVNNMSFATVSSVDEFKQEVREIYVTKDSFDPVKRLVYGLVALILVAVVGAVLGLVLRKG